MSSPKNYKLEIVPPLHASPKESRNLLKFTVKHHSTTKILVIKYLSLVIALSSFITYITYHLENIRDGRLELANYLAITGQIIIVALLCSLQPPEDSITVMKGIGIQLNSRKMWRFQSSNAFVPIDSMIDLVIHEGFHDYGQVIFYLCVLTKASGSADENSITVVFPEFLPRKDILLTVWTLSRELLFGSTQRYWRRVPGQGLKQVN
ncbi:Phosphatidylinositol N-acetylglucosaminyltransferase subunit gpi15 [Candida viswanathii]|uniref:Phosphatidylinositol N-acetylglucosaminyltransferase subunit gpi15 n=1 Tax=Candida viswanathii TaxID=5486 RepID=A0A367YKF2_9ASCO|nr:Phosphatidylinositol N-acetylglucosaminyltransferase subunit gpi15 [Candida viswanathii]